LTTLPKVFLEQTTEQLEIVQVFFRRNTGFFISFSPAWRAIYAGRENNRAGTKNL